MSRPSPMRSRSMADSGFNCGHCHRFISSLAVGTAHRNHCPACLWSCHLDQIPGDRQCACRGDMEPIAIWVRDDGEWAIVHRCCRCSSLRSNRIAGDDDPAALLRIAVRPLANPAFSLKELYCSKGNEP